MNVDDRVVGVGSAYGVVIDGQQGTLIGKDDDDILLVDFDKRFSQCLHNGNDVIVGVESQNGWFCKEDNLRRVL